MAFAGAGRFDDAAAVIAKLEAAVRRRTASSNAMMTAEVGLPAARAVLAFAEDRHDDVVETLAPIRRKLHRFGGSHAQRDVLQRTLLESALRSGRYEFAARADLRASRPSARRACTAGRGAGNCPPPSATTTRRGPRLSGPPPCGPASPPPDRCLRHPSARVLRALGRHCDTPSSSWGHDLRHSLCWMPDPRSGVVPDLPVRPRRPPGAGHAGGHRRRHRLQRSGPRRAARAQVPQPAPSRRPRRRRPRRSARRPSRRCRRRDVGADERVATPAARVRSGRADRPRRRRPPRPALPPPARTRRGAAPAQTGRSRRQRLSGPRLPGPPTRRRDAGCSSSTTWSPRERRSMRRHASLRRGGAADVVLAAVAATPDCLLPATRVA